jgi:multimeric flavodoxin WrbA
MAEVLVSTEANHLRALGIVGSPRRGGNTEVLVDEVLRGAEEAGAQVEKVILSGLEIAPCRACDACRKIGKCVQEDDMPALLEKMQGSEVWVLGTPVYWWGPTAQFKAYLDRWYGALIGRIVRFRGKRIVLVIPMEDTNAGGARHTVGILTEALNYVGAEVVATVLAPGVHRRGEVRERTDLIEAAWRAGQEVIQGEASVKAEP